LDLDKNPILPIEENEKFATIIEAVIDKSTVYDELCGLYCR
jgi:hypothetical protein